jgi:hypothetical protein
MFGLDATSCGAYTEHRGSFDLLHAIVTYLVTWQNGCGMVAVSPR